MDRIDALAGEGRTLVRALLFEFLPLDHVRRAELIAQVQLGSLALTDSSLRLSVIRLNDDVCVVCAGALAELEGAGDLSAGRDREEDGSAACAARQARIAPAVESGR